MSGLFLTDDEMRTMKEWCEDSNDRLVSRMYAELVVRRVEQKWAAPDPVPMRLNCPDCGELHLDEGEFATKPHHTHACQHCGNVWRPAVVATVGVRFLPGFKNEER
jgi:predicted RNA-binding Zn-ribbon protein involved in translation (DUF1610 family)